MARSPHRNFVCISKVTSWARSRTLVDFSSVANSRFALLLALFTLQTSLLLAGQTHLPGSQIKKGSDQQPADPGPGKPSSANTVLGIHDARFTLNGQPTFLLGISYFAALGASRDSLRADLDQLQRDGFNWLRVWATWNAFDADISAVDSHGERREPFLAKLQQLVRECDRRGLVVDVTLTRKQESSNRVSGGLLDFPAHQKAVETLVDALKGQRNWYLDLANERDVHDSRYVSPAELKTLRDLARRLDPQLLVTASTGGHDLTQSDVYDSLVISGLDFLSPHRPREAGSPSQTEAQTRTSLSLAKAVQRIAPINYQEPFRRGYGGWEPTADDFLADLRGALAGGAAGWCFHNGSERRSPDHQPRRSFDLRVKRLFDQLDPQELKVVAQVKAVVDRATDTISPRADDAASNPESRNAPTKPASSRFR